LNAALEEGDPKMFSWLLRNVAEACGGMRHLSRATQLNRANLHRMLSHNGNPEVRTLRLLLDSFGLRLAVAPKDTRRRAA